jgi:hypothetical protein
MQAPETRVGFLQTHRIGLGAKRVGAQFGVARQGPRAVRDINDAAVPALPGRLSALRVLHSKSTLYGAFVWACRMLNGPKRRFPPWAPMAMISGSVG